MYSDIKNKEEINAALLLTSMSDHEDINKVEKLSHPNSIRSNQEPLKCGTVMKLGSTPTVNGARLCVLTSTFKGK